MPETVDLIKDDGGDYHLAGDADATLRVGKAAWTKYVNALASMKSAALQIEKTATRPVYCTPEQEEALRSVAKPGAWIVVREQGSPPSTVPLVADGSTVDENGRPEDSGSSLSLVVPAVAPPPPGPPRRPRPGRCPDRGGLPHTALRYVITEALSEYDKGRVRIDGLCQCGERIPDVKCPHQRQVLNAAKQPSCEWCRAVLVAGAGVIDNRTAEGIGGGALDPNKPIPIPPGVDHDNDNVMVKTAYRAPGS